MNRGELRRLIIEAAEIRDEWPRPISSANNPLHNRAITLIDELAAVDRTDLAALDALIEALDKSLGSGVWLDINDREQFRTFHNVMAQAAEDVVMVYRRVLGDLDG